MIDEVNWITEFQGKTLRAIRTRHGENGTVPFVLVMFDDGSTYEVHVKDDTYFEAAMFNSLRRAQPVSKVHIFTGGNRTTVEVKAETFPLFLLRAVDRRERGFPFELVKVRDAR